MNCKAQTDVAYMNSKMQKSIMRGKEILKTSLYDIVIIRIYVNLCKHTYISDAKYTHVLVKACIINTR